MNNAQAYLLKTKQDDIIVNEHNLLKDGDLIYISDILQAYHDELIKLGYVHKDLIEIDEEKVKEIIKVLTHENIKENKHFTNLDEITRAIGEAKNTIIKFRSK